MIRIYVFTIWTLITLQVWAGIDGEKKQTSFSVQSPVKPQELFQHLKILGSDSLQGRGTGTKGGKLAADYIARILDEWQLTPAGASGTFYQNIPMHGSQPSTGSMLRIFQDDSLQHLQLKKDYLLYKTGAQTFIPQPVPIVFVGYGILAPEFDYNDYQTVDVEGKVVVFLSGEPVSKDPDYFNGVQPTIYSLAESKQRIALSRGALGSIMVPNPRLEYGRTWEDWQQEFAFEDVHLAYQVTGNLSLVLNLENCEWLFAESAVSVSDIFEWDRQNTMRSFPLQASLSFWGEFEERDFIAQNVVALLEGNHHDFKDRYLVVTAHYDHLGIGPPVHGDSIYNGVFDNAAGVAAVLEIAKAFAEQPQSFNRSVLFLFVTGEEKGLLGSRYYIDNPVVPLHKTIANVNVDGLAMFDTFNDIVGIGAEYSTLNQFLYQFAEKNKLQVSAVPIEFMGTESFYRSDQIAYAQAGIPSVLIMEGLNYRHRTRKEGLQQMIEWYEKYYHTPFDDLNQPMNLNAAAQHTNILFAFCKFLTNHQATPEWNPGVPYLNPRLQSIAEEK